MSRKRSNSPSPVELADNDTSPRKYTRVSEKDTVAVTATLAKTKTTVTKMKAKAKAPEVDLTKTTQLFNTTFPETLGPYPPAPSGCHKIVSWNLASLNAAIRKGASKYLEAEDPDIICLQETKIHHAPSPATATTLGISPKVYPHRYFACATKKGYSGTAIYSKVKPSKITYGMPGTNMPTEEEGRIITLTFPAYTLVAAYVPNSGEKLIRLARREKWDASMLQYIRLLQDAGQRVILAGDLNVAFEDRDLSRPDSNHKSAGFTDQERAGFARFLNAPFSGKGASFSPDPASEPRMYDALRLFHPKTPCLFTYFSYRGGCRSKGIGWRLDYFLLDPALRPHLRACEIRGECWGASDHLPLFLILDLPIESGASPADEKE